MNKLLSFIKFILTLPLTLLFVLFVNELLLRFAKGSVGIFYRSVASTVEEGLVLNFCIVMLLWICSTVLYFWAYRLLYKKDARLLSESPSSYLLKGYKVSRVYAAQKIELCVFLIILLYFLFGSENKMNITWLFVILIIIKEIIDYMSYLLKEGDLRDKLLAAIKSDNTSTICHVSSNFYFGLSSFSGIDRYRKLKLIQFILNDHEASYIKYKSIIQKYLKKQSRHALTVFEDKKIRKRIIGFESQIAPDYFNNWFYRNLRTYLILLDSEINDEKINRNIEKNIDEYYKVPHVQFKAYRVGNFINTSLGKILRFVANNGNLSALSKKQDVSQINLIDNIDYANVISDTAVESIYEMGTKYVILYYSLYKMPKVLYNLFKRTIVCDSYLEGVVKILDYLDMVGHLYVYFFYTVAFNEQADIAANIKNYRNIARYIIETLNQIDGLYILNERLRGKVSLNVIQKELKQAVEVFNITYDETPYLTFLGVFNLLQFLRNKTRGHGVINSQHSKWLYSLLVKLCMIINYYLMVDYLQITEEGDTIVMELMEKRVSMSTYVRVQQDRFYILSEARRSSFVYLDYLNGELFIPDYVYLRKTEMSAPENHVSNYKQNKKSTYELLKMLLSKALLQQERWYILFEMLLLLSKEGNLNAKRILGQFYYEGRGVDKDYQKAYEIFSECANKGDAASKFFLGNMFEKRCNIGFGVLNNINAEVYYVNAWKSGHWRSAMALIRIYSNTKSFTKVIQIYEELMQKGYPFAYRNMATMYLNGHGVLKSPEKALELYEKAARSKDLYGMAYLGKLLQSMGDERGNAEGEKWLKKAAENGNGLAMYYLGQRYLDERKEIDDETIDLLENAFEKGQTNARLSLSILMLEGTYSNKKFVFKHDILFLQYINKKAELGSSDAKMMQVIERLIFDSDCYEKQAFVWVKEMAEKNNDFAQYFLGSMYLNGRGTEKSKSDALEWVQKYLDKGLRDEWGLMEKINNIKTHSET